MPRGRPKGSVTAYGPKIKNPMSAYACFVKTCREEHKKMHPDENVQFGELASQCSQRWKTMSDKEKEKFHEMAESDKERYHEQMKDYIPPVGVGTMRRRQRRRRMRKEKDPNRPKRALSAFFYFAKDERPGIREKNPDFTVGETAKELGRKWNELSAEVKAPYEKQAEEDRARYDVEIKKYKANCGAPPAKRQKTENGHHMAAPREEAYDDEDDEESEGEDEEYGE